MFYYYDGTKQIGFHGYRTEKAALKDAIAYAETYPTRQIGVYKERGYGGDFIGRVYIGMTDGKKTPKYKTHTGTYNLNRDGSVGTLASTGRYLCERL